MQSVIIIEEMEFFANHGFYPEEQLIGCKYSVDLKLYTDIAIAAANDELENTINYEIVYKITRKEMDITSKLIENVAFRIAKALKDKFKQLTKVELTLYKYNPPLGGKLNRVGINLIM